MSAEMRKLLICDFDGTLTDIRPIQHLVGEWEEFHERSFHCEPNIEIVDHVTRMDEIYDVIIVTGKGEAHRDTMLDWLLRHEVPVERVLMRPLGNFESDTVLKPALMEQAFGEGWRSRVSHAIEDRDKMVDAWRALGITTFQCARSLY